MDDDARSTSDIGTLMQLGERMRDLLGEPMTEVVGRELMAHTTHIILIRDYSKNTLARSRAQELLKVLLKNKILLESAPGKVRRNVGVLE